MANSKQLRISEIFLSLQGESISVGLPTIFIRLTGCPLRCQYCDTAYAFSGGKIYSQADIFFAIKEFTTSFVTVTGGEPLAQSACLDLLSALCDAGYKVQLETSGTLSTEAVDPRVTVILDIKTPGSKEHFRNLWQNIEYVKRRDQIKFVICDRNDFDWAITKIDELHLIDKCEVLFSPEHENMDNQQLAEWILQEKLQVRMQLQMHKYIWGNQPGK